FAVAQGTSRARPGDIAMSAHCAAPADRVFPGKDSQDAPFEGQVYLCARACVRDSGPLTATGCWAMLRRDLRLIPESGRRFRIGPGAPWAGAFVPRLRPRDLQAPNVD